MVCGANTWNSIQSVKSHYTITTSPLRFHISLGLDAHFRGIYKDRTRKAAIVHLVVVLAPDVHRLVSGQ